jgi:hypothetical protein
MTRSRDVADTQDNLGGAVPPFVAGKNKYINGDFNIWQRGTTFTGVAAATYTADRWRTDHDGTGTATVSRQTFTSGAAPVAGYENPYFLRHQIASSGTASYFQISQLIEDARTFAGQTITASFWAKADTARTAVWYLEQNFGSGGSGGVLVAYVTFNITTSWARYSVSFNMPSISGKTVGTNSYLYTSFRQGTTSTGGQLDLWGIQLEAGSVATPFTTATGTLQGELAACQRYYWRQNASALSSKVTFGVGATYNAARADVNVQFPVSMRVIPTAIDYPTVGTFFRAEDSNTNGAALTTLTLSGSQTSNENGTLVAGVASGLTTYRPTNIVGVGTGAYIGYSAEF